MLSDGNYNYITLLPNPVNHLVTISNLVLLPVTAINKAYKMFEDDEQVKYCEAIVEEARSQLETKVSLSGGPFVCHL